jgi:hypothetical protein
MNFGNVMVKEAAIEEAPVTPARGGPVDLMDSMVMSPWDQVRIILVTSL